MYIALGDSTLGNNFKQVKAVIVTLHSVAAMLALNAEKQDKNHSKQYDLIPALSVLLLNVLWTPYNRYGH